MKNPLSSILNRGDGRFATTPDSITVATVIKNIDNDHYGKIVARIDGIDDIIIDNNNLPICFPLSTSATWIRPKIGDKVIIIFQNIMLPYGNRFYVGPVEQDIDKTINNNTDVVIQGKNNTRLHMSSDFIRLEFNHNKPINKRSMVTLDVDKIIINADDIELHSHKGKQINFSAVLGEELVNILRFILKVLRSHQHPPNGPPTPEFISELNRIESNIDGIILSKHIKIN